MQSEGSWIEALAVWYSLIARSVATLTFLHLPRFAFILFCCCCHFCFTVIFILLSITKTVRVQEVPLPITQHPALHKITYIVTVGGSRRIPPGPISMSPGREDLWRATIDQSNSTVSAVYILPIKTAILRMIVICPDTEAYLV